jgi:hypothetical protein
MAPGPARFLAQAEEALRADAPGEVASNLAEAGRAMGGALGAALLEHAARCREAARDRVAAASARAEAAKLDPYAARSLPGQLRDAARADDRAARALLDELASGPEGVLSIALARWTAAVASRAGDKKHAAVLREGLAPVTAAAARDRIDQESAAGVALDPASLERLRAGITGAAGIAVLSWIEAGISRGAGRRTPRSGSWDSAIAANPDAIPLGLLAQQIATIRQIPTCRRRRSTCGCAAIRATGRGGARAGGGAAVRHAATRTQLAARGALQTAIEAAPGSALFWSVAAGDARAGGRPTRRPRSRTAPRCGGRARSRRACAACALAHLGLGDPARAFEGLRRGSPNRPMCRRIRSPWRRGRGSPSARATPGRSRRCWLRPPQPPIRSARRRWHRGAPIWWTRPRTPVDAPAFCARRWRAGTTIRRRWLCTSWRPRSIRRWPPMPCGARASCGGGLRGTDRALLSSAREPGHGAGGRRASGGRRVLPT